MPNQFVNPHECVFIQSRATVNFAIVDEYAALMSEGTQFEPCKGFVDADQRIYIFDGYHRGEAAKQTGKFIEVELAQGTKDAAEWAALHANITHGLRRSRDDIERVVKAALTFPRAVEMSNVEIARHCGCDEKTVRKYRAELEASSELPKMDTRKVERNGKTYEMKLKQTEIPLPEPAPPPERQDVRAVMQPRPLVSEPPKHPTTQKHLGSIIKASLLLKYPDRATAQAALRDMVNSSSINRADPPVQLFHEIAEHIESLSLQCTRADIRTACQGALTDWEQLDQEQQAPDAPASNTPEPEKPEWERAVEEFEEFCNGITDEPEALAPLPNPDPKAPEWKQDFDPQPLTDVKTGVCPFCEKRMPVKHLYESQMNTRAKSDHAVITVGICQPCAAKAFTHFEVK